MCYRVPFLCAGPVTRYPACPASLYFYLGESSPTQKKTYCVPKTPRCPEIWLQSYSNPPLRERPFIALAAATPPARCIGIFHGAERGHGRLPQQEHLARRLVLLLEDAVLDLPVEDRGHGVPVGSGADADGVELELPLRRADVKDPRPRPGEQGFEIGEAGADESDG